MEILIYEDTAHSHFENGHLLSIVFISMQFNSSPNQGFPDEILTQQAFLELLQGSSAQSLVMRHFQKQREIKLVIETCFQQRE